MTQCPTNCHLAQFLRPRGRQKADGLSTPRRVCQSCGDGRERRVRLFSRRTSRRLGHHPPARQHAARRGAGAVGYRS
eukprot:3230782-Prymnesium_polylepis.1